MNNESQRLSIDGGEQVNQRAANATPAGERARPLPHTSAASTSITRMNQTTVFGSKTMESKRLIHPDMADTRQVDAFRELRTSLLLRCNGDNPIIVVTGVSAGCGTSFVARNLATAIALDESRTALLIDCHLRRPSLQEAFAIDPTSGGVLEFLESPGIGLSSIIYPTGVPRLRLIPAGRRRPSSGEVFSSYRMRVLLDVLSTRYPDRCLVLDAPPTLGSPDARLLAELADSVVLVAGAGLHQSREIAAATRVFAPAKFAGVVFNQLP